MASEDDSNLRSLEALMSEFFASSTTNERKRQIEELLNNFSAQSGAWRHCFFFLSHTCNEYVMMYCLTVFENVINRTWIGIPMEDKLEIRNSLSKLLLTRHKSVPPFIRNKLVKVLVDIGRLDWPHYYPEFFTEIFQLIQQNGTSALGLIILQTTSEELACPREDLSVARKEELHSLLLQQVPTILSLLTGVLESVLDKHRHLVTTATPPPSPTHDDSSSNSPTSQKTFAMFSTSPLQSGSILSSMFQSPGSSKQNVQPLPPLDQDSEQLSGLALSCLNHLFSWIPLSTNITPALLTTIFQFASFGCDINTVQNNPSLSQGHTSFSKTGSSNLGVLAMCCINELMSKNCVPAEFEEFLLRMFQQTFQLLQRLTKDTTAQSVGNKLAELDENYIEKFTEFLRLFVSVHLRRFEGNSQFPLLELLALLFKYTFKQPNNEGFYVCLDIWMVFIDYLVNETRCRTAEREEVVNRYKDALVSLVSELIHKLQFRFNQSQLEEMDDETLDDDCETEWQYFLRQCIEVVARVAELLPNEVFSLMYPPFQDYSEVYLGLQQFVTGSDNDQRRLNISVETDCRRLHCTLRDLSSLLQALGRHADHFIADKFTDRLHDALSLMNRLCQCSVYGTKMRLYDVHTPIPTVLRPDFIQVHAQALAALQAFNQWVAQFYLETQRHGKEQEQFVAMVTTMVDALTPLLAKGVPDKIAISAAHLFLSIATSIRPAFLMQLPNVQKLFNDVSGGSLSTLPIEVELLVYRALSNILILPWPNIAETEQQWPARSANHLNYIKRLTEQFRNIQKFPFTDDKQRQETAKPCIKKTLTILVDLVESVSGEVTKTKQICYTSLQDSIQFTISIFPIHIRQPDVVEEILNFFLAVFQSLRIQMGVSFTEQAIQTFMNLFTREQLADTILNDGSTGCRIVEKFLRILQILVQEPGSASKRFLPSIITLCMDQIYPIIAERSSPDIKSVLFELLHLLLLYNWRYFFRSSVLDSMKSGNETMENQPRFVAIMQAFGQSFLQPDIAIFKQNLEALETLNTKWKLYYKKYFREVMLFQFLNVLLQVLVHKSHDLLQEEILITVYNMASVDFDNFFSNFLLQFLASCDGLDHDQKAALNSKFSMDRDLPSFTQSLRRLVNDLRYFRIQNSALPEGSVKL
ncbi:exportin-6-like [Saccoglossus kowalevskii]|uniref:Exportin-6-like n=1 Tax=Saccoglossus kowalevskii TaxID=10224 RepID=A0ABM0MUN5_SACKO|nr:PREDICTED: exportin-6-like [Saccoglossus kowalevskii]